MGQSVVETNVDGHLLRISFCQMPQSIFVIGVAGAQDNQLQIGSKDAFSSFNKQVESLLVGNSGNHAQQRNVPACRQPHASLQILFTLRFSGLWIIG